MSATNKPPPAASRPVSTATRPTATTPYFENAQGEQLIFIYDREADTGTLYHGDLGWNQPRPVVDGKCPSIVLDEAETLWLRACWMAATALKKRSM